LSSLFLDFPIKGLFISLLLFFGPYYYGALRNTAVIQIGCVKGISGIGAGDEVQFSIEKLLYLIQSCRGTSDSSLFCSQEFDIILSIQSTIRDPETFVV